jgi:hypothetical protein
MVTCYRCHYFTDNEECIIHKLKNDRQILNTCESFIDKDFTPQFSDSCGIMNWPKPPSLEDAGA